MMPFTVAAGVGEWPSFRQRESPVVKTPSAGIIIALLLLPWVPVFIYGSATSNTVEGANIGTGLLGLLALVTGVVLVAIYIRRGGKE